ncbi:MAG: peptidoglycan DD-metalloendopeptidase family protein [Candidatus Kerfeldbacteria bacterium]|nr:peptidoglycan DD-metalloendopeptidase family protein [Candidatus Kerfeldbacteria bacterium]
MGTKTKTILAFSIAAAFAIAFFALTFAPLRAEEPPQTTAPPVDVSDLEGQIREQRDRLEELERKKQVYEQNIAKKRQEALSLKNQISILDDQISTTDTDIRKLGLEIKLLGNEIERLDSSIELKNTELKQQKERLAELLRLLQRYNNKTTLEVTLLNDTFSDFFNQLKYLETIEHETKTGLDELAALKADLELDKSDREERRTASEERRQQLDIEKKNLTSQQDYREGLLTDTKESEQQFEELLNQAKQEQLNANADIQSLEAQIRQRLTQDNELPAGPTAFAWPIPSRRITAYFHDPTYPFKKYFQHPAVDIATPQGTPVRAAASGFVARAKNSGLGYSYIMLVHGDGLSTVYGHISSIAVVEEDFVVQGQIIGYSGGTPGTPGAGRLTTGPHLHLEVRLNGIPVDPLGYLP